MAENVDVANVVDELKPEQAVEVVQQAIQPVAEQVPNIVLPIQEAAAKFDIKNFTGRDYAIIGGTALTGAAIAEGVRWLIKNRPVKKFFENIGKVANYIKETNQPQVPPTASQQPAEQAQAQTQQPTEDPAPKQG